MYIDLEGVDLCREGSLSILTLLIDTGIPTIRVCPIDVYSLGSQAFNTTGIKLKTLKDILQDKKIPKVFFDVRNDSDALFAHFGVTLQGVEDVQLMESVTRMTTRSRKYLNGLAKCVETKEKGERFFKTEHWGSSEIFNQRPIPNDIISYCVDLVNDKTKKRVTTSQKPEYQPHGPNRTLAPWSEEQNRTLDEWNHVPPPYDYFDDDYFNDDCFDDYWDDGRGDDD
ncbi:hypothetical protein BDY21DRAFT_388691 [Lineolata rhizophorae]|uniref:3'-5' exonuclease domain-containing protein n=1 Tax=Lineolata rhizophorae TaxID=578093 RepID=A0A6A6NKT8_9PEZI|nr:hypothetical protein BDY21DRAFT_388691 [Lineolata rhizophorae]